MSCVDKVPKRKASATKEAEVNNRKPLSDFQPDDRWGIKEVGDSTNSPQNPKTKRIKTSNGCTPQNQIVSAKPGDPQLVALYTTVAGSSGGQPKARMPLNMRPLRPVAPYQGLNTPPSQVVKGSNTVVCEICDSHIKDLEELRTHMNWVHKVKIHPIMLVERPPLNCPNFCQRRFFTDQGLERHLLLAHGMVSTNMQEMANKNQDGGQCSFCDEVFTYKLLSHMTEYHKLSLKPAYLSYKCTVCTATFTLYRLFKSHVYNVHSGSAKRNAEESSVAPPAKKPAALLQSGPKECKECNFVTENMHEHIIQNHLKEVSVKMSQIEKCKKYKSDKMLLIQVSDSSVEEDDDKSSSEGVTYPKNYPENSIADAIAELQDITTLEQRRMYKSLYNEKLEKYKNLTDDISLYEKDMKSLHRTSKMYSKGSDEYKKLKSKYLELWSYHGKKIDESDELQSLLERILHLVRKFDSAQK